MRGALALLLVIAGCSSEERRRNDLPYAGDAWPESHPTYAIDKASLVVVSNNLSDSITLVDLAKNASVATVSVDLDPIAVDGPHHAVVDPSGEFIYTPFAYPREGLVSGPHAEHGASPVPGILVKLRAKDLTRVETLTVENNPGDAVMTPDGSRVIVSHFDLLRAIEGLKAKKPLADLRAPVVFVDPATMSRVAAPAPCVASHGMAVSADSKTLYVACYGEDAIGILDIANPNNVELVALGAALGTPPDVTFGPYFVTLADAGKALLISETEGKAIRLLDLATRKTSVRTPLDGAVFGPTATKDGKWLVPVQAPDKLVLLDAALAVEKTRAFTGDECIKPHQIARHRDRFLLVCEGDHVKPGKLLEIDGASLATVRSFDVGVYPDVIAFPIGQGR